jgi:hypothetical protein
LLSILNITKEIFLVPVFTSSFELYGAHVENFV